VVQVEDARALCERCRWADAWELWSHAVLSDLEIGDLEIDDLDRAGTAAYLSGHDEEGFALWVKAHQACLSSGSVHRAAHFGAKLAHCLGFKGDLGRCRGWVDRTARMLEEANIDCVEQGYLEWGLGTLRVFESGDAAGARAHFTIAGKIGSRFAHRELMTLARIGEGRMLIYLGEIQEGLALLDEAMVAIEAGELSPLATGDAYCTVIDACSELFDVVRCRAWTASMVRWCDTQQGLVLYRGNCFMHRAEVLGLSGEWREALAEARRACDRLADPVNLLSRGGAAVVEGDLRRLIGDLDGAATAYARASEYGCDPQPGLSMLRLAQGRLGAADAMIRRSLDEAQDPISRARLLVSFVEIVLCAGDVASARAAAEELREVAITLGTPLLRAHAACGLGAVLAAEGEPKTALVQLRQAFNDLRDLGVRYDAARTRLLIADVCAALGDHDAADIEGQAARVTLEALSTAADPVATPRQRSTPSTGGLTDRELEVLRLLAQGKTNRTIAQELVISEKTVASHVSHIFTKTGVASRSAATAFAYGHGLVG
jgi:DNA-binding CsgD family transcriptional regulator/tetratricopeptide (TPR) repeat protein